MFFKQIISLFKKSDEQLPQSCEQCKIYAAATVSIVLEEYKKETIEIPKMLKDQCKLFIYAGAILLGVQWVIVKNFIYIETVVQGANGLAVFYKYGVVLGGYIEIPVSFLLASGVALFTAIGMSVETIIIINRVNNGKFLSSIAHGSGSYENNAFNIITEKIELSRKMNEKSFKAVGWIIVFFVANFVLFTVSMVFFLYAKA